jgi:hypothetical protein
MQRLHLHLLMTLLILKQIIALIAVAAPIPQKNSISVNTMYVIKSLSFQKKRYSSINFGSPDIGSLDIESEF